MSYETIQYAIDQGVLTITLHRPEKLNAFTREMQSELCDALDRADADDNVRAIIVTGAGRAFCAGADLSSGSKTFDADARSDRDSGLHPDGGGVLTLRIYECKKPIIAAINGPAVGVGVTMTLAMDIRIASDNAKFGFVFARRGIVPEACSSYFLPRVVGISQALEWCYSGRVFPAQEALDGGLLRSLHSKEDLLPAAQTIAREIADNTSAISVTMVRQMMWKMLGADHPMEHTKWIPAVFFIWANRQMPKKGSRPFWRKDHQSFLAKLALICRSFTLGGHSETFPNSRILIIER